MKQNLLNKLWLRGLMLVALLCTAFTGAWADKITDYNDIVSGKKYYIGATTGGNDYYLSVNGSSTTASIAGTAVTSAEDATVFTFSGSDTSWTIQFESGYYLSLKSSKDNGKVQVVEDEATFTASNQTAKSLIRLTISTGTFSIQKNNSGTQFGSYSNTQTDIWLEEVPEASPLASIALSGSYPTTFHQGDDFSHEGITVTATYENTSTKDVTEDATFSGYDMTVTGEQTVTVSYTEGDVTKTTEYTITVNAPATLTSITLSGTYPTEFTQGDEFSSEGIEVTANFDDETTSDVTGEATFEGYDMSMVGEQEVTVSYGGKTATYTITVNEYVMPSELTVDFESALSTYKEWVFTNAEQGSGSIAAHAGTYYGTTGGKATASIQTKDIIPNPGTFTCYVSKQSTNTTASTWYIQVSSDGSSWTEVESQSATDMTKGEWKEFTADLSSYSNVYVRLYYNGSTAVRNVDDIILEMATPKALSSIALSGTYPTTFHVGDAFSHEGMAVTATYEGGKTADVTTSATFSGYDMSTVGVQTITVSYTENEVTETATYDITVNAPATLTSIVLSGTYPTEFQQGDAFSSDGIVVTANYDDDTTSDVTGEASFSGYDMDVLGDQTVTVTYEGQTASYTITVVEKKGTEDNPYTVAEAIAFINTLGSATSVEEVYVSGIVSQVDSYNSSYSSITYWISDDGTTTGQMEVYSGKGMNGADFSSVDDLKVGDIVTVKGYVKMYKGTPEFDKNNILVSFERPVVTTPYIEVSATTVEATAAGQDGTITVTYNNLTDVLAEVQFVEADGTTSATYDWIVADINGDNNVEYVVGENTDTEARTAYMKVYAVGNGGEAYSELITITQAGMIVDYAVVPFAYDGGKSNLPTGFTQNGLGTDYSSKPYLKFDSTGDYLIVKVNKEAAMLLFDIKGNSFSGGTFTVQTSADGTIYTDLEAYTDLGDTQTEMLALTSGVRYIKWIYTEKDKGNVGLGFIRVVDWIETVTVGEAGYATYVTEHNTSFPTDVTAYIGAVNGKYLSMTAVTAVPKGTPVVLKGDAGTYTLIPTLADRTDDVNANELKSSETDVVADGTQYVLAKPAGEKIGFYQANSGSTIAAGKAYLEIASEVKAFYFSFDDDATSINEELRMKSEESAAIYNLAGQRIQKMQRGINIVNGKKVLK